MKSRSVRRSKAVGAGLTIVVVIVLFGFELVVGQQDSPVGEQGFRFRTGVELINVTASVTDSSGRFVSGLQKDDFRVFEDGAQQTITHFSNERVPVSLGIALDTSGSMAGEKFTAAQNALDRFLYDLLDPEDEVFLFRFSSDPILVEGWTTNRERLSRAIARISPSGGTAMYDTVAEAVPMAQTGRHPKKALVIISDGVDTTSRTDVQAVRQLIRETEVLVYAIGIDGRNTRTITRAQPRPPIPIPIPLPIPGRRMPPSWPGAPPVGGRITVGDTDRVDVNALRQMTDDSGGRTEVVRNPRDLDPATASIADELRQQYYLGYPAPGHRDGRWHSITVEVNHPTYRVRARRGYVASP